MKNKLSAILYIATYPLSFLKYFVPRDKNTIVFGAWYGDRYADNPRYLYEYMIKNSEYNCVWITKNVKIIQQIEESGGVAFHALSLKGLAAQLRAGWVIVSHSVRRDLYAPAINPRAISINLWHGMGVKKIGHDAKWGKIKRSIEIILEKISPRFSLKSDYFVTSGDAGTMQFKTAFRANDSQCLPFGLPRLDFLRKKNFNDGDEVNIVYMPTLRENIDATGIMEMILLGSDSFSEISANLRKINANLSIRLHPKNILDSSNESEVEHFDNIKFDKAPDFYDVIDEYDVMVTDFSSSAFDFFFLGRPVIFVSRDIDKYKDKERGLYYNYSEFAIPPHCDNWGDVFHFISRKGYATAEYKNLAEIRRNMYFGSNDRPDGVSSCELISEFISRNKN